ncbi:protease modulator HflC [Sphingomonas immobilis]|uniref:Protein HflC n=1 Tax=Sphingomonas immobilis TaxID=3063997 RepID=A0ABT9A077_9SPHN|nr:protease modulator HflC [Sphingomonas sp. CA1-15]MDO7843239.1 protease modulator HflC [Sphingomonas sp. CA1-15]
MNAATLRNPIAIAIAVLLALILLASTVAIVPETKQAVILRFEQPVGSAINRWKPNEVFGRSGAGVTWRIPLIDRIVWVDKRVLDVELDKQPVLSTDQLRLEVDAYARFRIVDPLKAVVSTGSTSVTEQRVIDQLQPLFSSALRNELGKRPFAALLSPERGQVMDNIQIGLQHLASQYGVQIVDVRIKHAGLPDGTPLQSALDRMKTARDQEALTIRAKGEQAAQIIRAEADAKAAQIYAESFNKDPDFYDFYRAMQSYRYTFSDQVKGQTSLVLSPDNAYLKEFQGRR